MPLTAAALEQVFRQPEIPYEPEKHSLKAWAKYCLQMRGYKVIYAENADFAIETRDREKTYCKVTDQPQPADAKAVWIVWDRSTQSASIIPPQ